MSTARLVPHAVARSEASTRHERGDRLRRAGSAATGASRRPSPRPCRRPTRRCTLPAPAAPQPARLLSASSPSSSSRSACSSASPGRNGEVAHTTLHTVPRRRSTLARAERVGPPAARPGRPATGIAIGDPAMARHRSSPSPTHTVARPRRPHRHADVVLHPHRPHGCTAVADQRHHGRRLREPRQLRRGHRVQLQHRRPPLDPHARQGRDAGERPPGLPGVRRHRPDQRRRRSSTRSTRSPDTTAGTYQRFGCRIEHVVLGSAGALISQNCSHHVAVRRTSSSAATGPSCCCATVRAGATTTRRPNADRMSGTGSATPSIPVSADQLVAALEHHDARLGHERVRPPATTASPVPLDPAPATARRAGRHRHRRHRDHLDRRRHVRGDAPAGSSPGGARPRARRPSIRPRRRDRHPRHRAHHGAAARPASASWTATTGSGSSSFARARRRHRQRRLLARDRLPGRRPDRHRGLQVTDRSSTSGSRRDASSFELPARHVARAAVSGAGSGAPGRAAPARATPAARRTSGRSSTRSPTPGSSPRRHRPARPVRVAGDGRSADDYRRTRWPRSSATSSARSARRCACSATRSAGWSRAPRSSPSRRCSSRWCCSPPGRPSSAASAGSRWTGSSRCWPRPDSAAVYAAMQAAAAARPGLRRAAGRTRRVPRAAFPRRLAGDAAGHGRRAAARARPGRRTRRHRRAGARRCTAPTTTPGRRSVQREMADRLGARYAVVPGAAHSAGGREPGRHGGRAAGVLAELVAHRPARGGQREQLLVHRPGR